MTCRRLTLTVAALSSSYILSATFRVMVYLETILCKCYIKEIGR